MAECEMKSGKMKTEKKNKKSCRISEIGFVFDAKVVTNQRLPPMTTVWHQAAEVFQSFSQNCLIV